MGVIDITDPEMIKRGKKRRYFLLIRMGFASCSLSVTELQWKRKKYPVWFGYIGCCLPFSAFILSVLKKIRKIAGSRI